MVFLKLKKAQTKNPLLEIFYWQDSQKREVDFVVKDGTRIKSLIQTCAEPERLETQKREIVPLIKAAKELKCHNLIVITLDKESEEKVEKRKLVFKPLWKWLLE